MITNNTQHILIHDIHFHQNNKPNYNENKIKY